MASFIYSQFTCAFTNTYEIIDLQHCNPFFLNSIFSFKRNFIDFKMYFYPSLHIVGGKLFNIKNHGFHVI